MAMLQSQSQRQAQKQAFALSAGQKQLVRMLEKNLPALREELYAEMNSNPVIESIGTPLETTVTEIETEKKREGADADYPEDDFQPGERRYDEEAVERRQAIFNNAKDDVTESETLQHHLAMQIGFSRIDPRDRELAEVLIGELDGNGYFTGSIPDLIMSQGATEEKILATLGEIMTFDPAGCGARTVRECLNVQMDKLDGNRLKPLVGRIVDGHLDEVAAGRYDDIAAALKTTRERVEAAVRLMRERLEPRPGNAYPLESSRIEYINPEVHIVRRDGRLVAETDARSLPEVRISPKYREMLEDKRTSAEVKAYVTERIAAAENLRNAVRRRQELVQLTAEKILGRQQQFFENGAAMSPFTEGELARELGVDPSWVSRTVNGKYASTPRGTMELRRFFSTPVKTAGGQELSRDAVMAAIGEIIGGEDGGNPFSDDAIAAELKRRGYDIARRTVAKYRDALGIPGKAARRKK